MVHEARGKPLDQTTLALDWNKDKSRMEKFSRALRAAMA
jgi:hypothetical protein